MPRRRSSSSMAGRSSWISEKQWTISMAQAASRTEEAEDPTASDAAIHSIDRSKLVKYARSAALVSEWRRDGSLVPEEVLPIYRYEQTFTLPRIGDALKRTSIIALIKVEPYDKGVVLPHEQTFPKHKEDRLR